MSYQPDPLSLAAFFLFSVFFWSFFHVSPQTCKQHPKNYLASEAPQQKLRRFSVSQPTIPRLMYPQLHLRPIPLAKKPSQLEGSDLIFFRNLGYKAQMTEFYFCLHCQLPLKNLLILGCDRATSNDFRSVIRVGFRHYQKVRFL